MIDYLELFCTHSKAHYLLLKVCIQLSAEELQKPRFLYVFLTFCTVFLVLLFQDFLQDMSDFKLYQLQNIHRYVQMVCTPNGSK